MGTGEKARLDCSKSKRCRVFKGRPGGELIAEIRRPIAEGDRFSELMAGDDSCHQLRSRSCGSYWRAWLRKVAVMAATDVIVGLLCCGYVAVLNYAVVGLI